MNLFSPALAWWQFLLLGLIPPLIVLLYFLKLKRHPLEVPSTYLWSRTIEDLHVNSIWQRLRQSLLLILQIILVLLIIFTLLRPGWRGTELEGERFIYLIDVSASMNATDVGKSRFEEAKKEVEKFIDQMKGSQAAMLISCSDKARVELSYRNNKRLLKEHLRSVKSSNRRSDLTEALRYAAGLANPAQTLDGTDPADDAKPATLHVFSDGNVAPVQNFHRGNLTVEYHAIGVPDSKNVAVTAFSTQRNPDMPGKLELFVRLEGFGEEAGTVNLKLYRDGQFIDAIQAEVGKHGGGAEFEIEEFDAGVLRVEIQEEDNLAEDNVAYAVVNTPRKANVLLVSEGNRPLALALSTIEAARIADVGIVAPAALTTDDHKARAAAEEFDLIIYDRCAPAEMPQANTIFIGRLPPGEEWKKNKNSGPPVILDSDPSHPLMQLVTTTNVRIVEGFGVEGPSGKTNLLDADIGPIMVIGPRGGFEDLVMSFEIVTSGPNGEEEPMTTWTLRRSFPVFVLNLLKYLGGGSGGEGDSVTVQPGQPIVLRTTAAVDRLVVTTPGGKTYPVARNAQNIFVHTVTEELGVYEVRAGDAKDVDQRFAVNLFDPQESNLATQSELPIDDFEKVEATAGVSEKRRDIWKWILILGLFVLVFEWYVYNRRVYF